MSSHLTNLSVRHKPCTESSFELVCPRLIRYEVCGERFNWRKRLPAELAIEGNGLKLRTIILSFTGGRENPLSNTSRSSGGNERPSIKSGRLFKVGVRMVLQPGFCLEVAQLRLDHT